MPRPTPRMFRYTTVNYGNPSKTVSTVTNMSDMVINKQKYTRSWSLNTPLEQQKKHWSSDATGQRVIMETAVMSSINDK